MPKRKQPEICTEEAPAKVTEASNALPGSSEGELSNQAPTAVTELTELEVAELGPLWSLLLDVGYTIW